MELKTITKIIMKYCIDLSTAENIAQDILCYVYPEYEDNVGGIMTSKEALENLVYNEILYRCNTADYGYEDYKERIQELYQTIKQDLERKEQLEKVIKILKKHLYVKELDIDYILEFNSFYSNHLIKPEYELLKEVLGE